MALEKPGKLGICFSYFVATLSVICPLSVQFILHWCRCFGVNKGSRPVRSSASTTSKVCFWWSQPNLWVTPEKFAVWAKIKNSSNSRLRLTGHKETRAGVKFLTVVSALNDSRCLTIWSFKSVRINRKTTLLTFWPYCFGSVFVL